MRVAAGVERRARQSRASGTPQVSAVAPVSASMSSELHFLSELLEELILVLVSVGQRGSLNEGGQGLDLPSTL